MRHRVFDVRDDADGTLTLEALASTRPAGHAPALAEVERVLDGAWQHVPHTHGL